MADAGARAGSALRRVTDELNGDERIVRQLEHGQVAVRRPLDNPGVRVADGLVSISDRCRSLTRRPTCKVRTISTYPGRICGWTDQAPSTVASA